MRVRRVESAIKIASKCRPCADSRRRATRSSGGAILHGNDLWRDEHLRLSVRNEEYFARICTAFTTCAPDRIAPTLESMVSRRYPRGQAGRAGDRLSGSGNVAAVIGEPISTRRRAHVPSRSTGSFCGNCDKYGVRDRVEVINGFAHRQMFAQVLSGIQGDILTRPSALLGFAPIAGGGGGFGPGVRDLQEKDQIRWASADLRRHRWPVPPPSHLGNLDERIWSRKAKRWALSRSATESLSNPPPWTGARCRYVGVSTW